MAERMTGPELRSWLARRLAEACFLDPGEVDVHRPMSEYGLSSRDAVTLAGDIEDLLDVELPSTLLFDHPTIAALAAGLCSTDTHSAPAGQRESTVHQSAGAVAPHQEDGAVAVVGLGCRFPGADGPERFWQALRSGEDAVCEVPDGRWAKGSGTGTAGGYLPGVDRFDAEFFNISPAEARRMDPQQRMLLEVTHEALRHAAISPDALAGTRTGVFVGISGNEYGHRGLVDPETVDPWSTTGAALSIAANRISYALDLRGPSMAVDTACSSSLVAVHNAVRSLRSGESAVALAAGANLLLNPAVTAGFDRLGVSAPGGRCRPFSADADGIVRAEGVGVVVLKRLADARADGDRVLAVVCGSVVNSDGRSNGLTAPNVDAQQDVLRSAYHDARIEPARVEYVEAHGTGTLLGDPIEARALGAVLGGPERTRPLLLGSVKGNLGHLEAAAGIAGLIKVVLALRHGVVPPSLHYAAPNPHIDFAALRAEVAGTERELGGDAVAGVSGFGFGGTNAHVVLRSAEPVTGPADPQRGPYRVVLGADARDRLADYARDLAAAAWPAGRPADLARSTARALSGAVRAAVVADDGSGIADGLRALAADTDVGAGGVAVVRGRRCAGPGAVWVFSGQGSQWAGMGREMLAAEPAFAAAIDELEPLLHAECGWSLRERISETEEPTDVATVQPMLFATQVALAELWRAHGHRPVAVLGHSMGEVAAAVVAGALTRAEGAHVVACRSRLLAAASGTGSMATVELPASETERLLDGDADVAVAAINSPDQTVISGTDAAVGRASAAARARGVTARPIKVDAPAHSPVLDPMTRELREQLAGLEPVAPRIPCYRTTSDDPRSDRALDAAYWAENFRAPVRFAAAVDAAARDGADVLVEVAPHPVLAAAIGDTLAAAGIRSPQVVSTMRRGGQVTRHFHAELARLQLAGLVDPPHAGAVAELPRPRWHRRPYWAAEQHAASGEHPLLGAHVRLPDGETHAWHRGSPLDGERVDWCGDYLGAAEYLEMAVSAGAVGLGADPEGLEVRGLRLQRPLPVADDAVLCTTLRRTGRCAQVTVTSRVGGAPSRVHATAEVRTAAPEASTVDHSGPPEPLAASRLSARWNCAPDVLAGVVGDAREVGRARRHGDPRAAATAVRDGADVALLDADGAVLVTLSGVCEPEGEQARPVPLRDKLYALRWQPEPPPHRPQAATVLVLDQGARDRACGLAAALRDADATVDVGATLPAQPPAHVVLPVPATDTADATAVGHGHLVVARVFDVVRALSDSGALHTRLWLITENAADLGGDGPVDPVAGALRSTVRVLAFEHPELRATFCDATDPAAVAAEVAADGPADEVAWRGENRYVARVAPTTVPVDPDATTVVRPDGGYVVTGGLRGVGLTMARWLSAAGAARIVLNGRSEPGDTARQAIEEMRTAGTEVLVVAGDIAADGMAERLVAAAGADGVPVRGVVHAAAVFGPGVTARMDVATLEAVWRPKAVGAWRLHVATAGLRLDFWLAFSSAAGLLGYPGDAAYCPANAFVDGLAAHRRGLGLPATSVAWGAWAHVGRVADRAAGMPGLRPADPVEYLEALEAVLAARSGPIGILSLSGDDLLALSESLASVPFYADIVAAGVPDAGWSGVDELRCMETSRARALLDARLVQRIASVLGVDEDRLDRHTPLTALGIDSLVAVRIRNAAAHDFDVLVPASLLLRGASLAEVQDWLAGEVLGSATGPAGAQPPALVPPRDAAERLVGTVCSAVLGHAVGMTQRIPELAEDNVVVEVAEQLTRRSGQVITAAQLSERATCERIALLVREPEHPDLPLRTLREGTADARPLFLFHPGGGDTLVYRQLVDQMDPAIPVYGFDRLDGTVPVEDRVAVYLPMLREIQPRGPYRLGGWSFGGALAYEMAARLVDDGEHVEVVAMIDTLLAKPIPENLDETGVLELRFRRFNDMLRANYGMAVDLPYRRLARLPDDQQIDLLIDTIEEAGLINSEVSPAIIRHQRTSYVDTLALQRYRPRHFRGRVVLFSAADRQPDGVRDPLFDRDDPPKGWDGVRGTDLEIVPTPGHHLSVLDPPNVNLVAQRLDAILRHVEPVSAGHR